MRHRITEMFAVLATLVVVATAWVLPLRIEAERRRVRDAGVDRVVDLTAVKDLGIWTADPVNATNYWSRELRPARPVLEVGRRTLLRLHSADVVHTFYIPELEVGPLEVYPGRVVEVTVTPRATGSFEYYCTTVCGEPHFAMKGEVIVAEQATAEPPISAGGRPSYWSLAPPGQGASRAAWGGWHFEQKGCSTCHGTAGRAGVENPNAMNPQVLELSALASNLFLFSAEDVQAFVRAIEQGRDLESLTDQPPVPLYRAVLTQHKAVRDVILNGRKTVSMDPDGLDPPLEMPSWRHRLSNVDIDAILAYLLTAEPSTTHHKSQIARQPKAVIEPRQKGR